MKSASSAALLVLACAATAARADLLTNGSLNLDVDANTIPDAWTNWMYGPTAFAAYKNDPPNDPFDFNGTPYVNAGNYGDWWTSGGGWFQVVPGAADTPYTFQAYCATEGWDNAAGELRIIYLDAASAVIRQDVLHSAEYIANQPWTRFTLTTTAPANTTQVKAEFATWGARGAVLWDDASLVVAHVWNVDSSGDFAVGGNWLGGTPAEADAVAQFAGAITAAQSIAIDAPVTLGGIRFDNANSYTLTGAATVTLSDSSGQASIDVYQGGHTIAAPLVLTSDTTVSVTSAGSQLTLSNLQDAPSRAITKTGAGALAVNNLRAATLTVTAGSVSVAATGGVSSLTLLNISPSGTLDLNDTDLITGAAKSTVEDLVRIARNAGAWDGPGITSSAARNNAQQNTNLGVLSGAEYTAIGGGNGTFGGLPYADTDTLVKYTWNGDTNFSGTVDFDDYVRVDVGFNTALTGWANGDFNYSGGVDFDDYVLIDVAFNTQSGTLSRAIEYISGDGRTGAGLDSPGVQNVIEHFDQFGVAYGAAFLAAVPEPSALAVLGVPALAGMYRRHRRTRHAQES